MNVDGGQDVAIIYVLQTSSSQSSSLALTVPLPKRSSPSEGIQKIRVCSTSETVLSQVTAVNGVSQVLAGEIDEGLLGTTVPKAFVINSRCKEKEEITNIPRHLHLNQPNSTTQIPLRNYPFHHKIVSNSGEYTTKTVTNRLVTRSKFST